MEFHKEIEDQRESTPVALSKQVRFTYTKETTDVIKISWI